MILRKGPSSENEASTLSGKKSINSGDGEKTKLIKKEGMAKVCLLFKSLTMLMMHT